MTPKQIRLSKNLTLKELSKVIGINAELLGKQERKIVPIDWRTLVALSNFYQIPIKKLI